VQRAPPNTAEPTDTQGAPQRPMSAEEARRAPLPGAGPTARRRSEALPQASGAFAFAAGKEAFRSPGRCLPPVFRSAICDCLSLNGSFLSSLNVIKRILSLNGSFLSFRRRILMSSGGPSPFGAAAAPAARGSRRHLLGPESGAGQPDAAARRDGAGSRAQGYFRCPPTWRRAALGAVHRRPRPGGTQPVLDFESPFWILNARSGF